MEVQNEMGVIVIFAQTCEQHGWRIVSIQSQFPDAVIENIATGEKYAVEFEYMATSFRLHGHDARECNIIVCWENDWPDCPMTIWELRNPDWPTVPVRVLDEKDAYILYLENLLNGHARRSVIAARSVPIEPEGVRGYSKKLGRWVTVPTEVSRYFLEMMAAGRSLSRSQWKDDRQVSRVHWEALTHTLIQNDCLDYKKELNDTPADILRKLLTPPPHQQQHERITAENPGIYPSRPDPDPTRTQTDGHNEGDDEEELMRLAIDLVRHEGGASITLLQRKFRIGYARAARMIDEMYEEGIIGPPVPGGRRLREILSPSPEKDRP